MTPVLPAFTIRVYDCRKIFVDRVGQRKIVYLDHNVWIDLRDPKTPEASACLETCREAVACARAIFPLSFPAVTEAIEIRDVATRLRHADLLDALSNGVTFRSSAVLLRLEAELAWRWLFNDEDGHVAKDEVFTSLPDHIGEGEITFPEGWTPDGVRKFVNDLLNAPQMRSVRFIAEMRDWGADHLESRERYVREMEANRQKRLAAPRVPKQQAFARALQGEREYLVKNHVIPAATNAMLAEHGPEGVSEVLGRYMAKIGECQFAASWGHLTAFFAGSWGHPNRRRMGPPARGRDPVFRRVMGPASEVFRSLMGPARDAAVGI